MNESSRLLQATLIAPIAAFVGGFVWFAVSFLSESGMIAGSAPFWASAFAFSIFLTVIGYVAVIAVALPLHFFLKKIAAVRVRNYVLAGLFVAAIGSVGTRPFSPHFVGLLVWYSVLVSASFGYLVAGSDDQ